MITRNTRRISVDTEDTFKQLEMVNNAKILMAILNEPVFLVDMFFFVFFFKWGTVKFIKVITQQFLIKCSMQAEVSQLLCWLTYFFVTIPPDSETFSAYESYRWWSKVQHYDNAESNWREWQRRLRPKLWGCASTEKWPDVPKLNKNHHLTTLLTGLCTGVGGAAGILYGD